MAKTNSKIKEHKKTTSIAEFVQRLYNQSAPLLICEALLLVLTAVLLIINPFVFLAALTLIVGICLIAFGLYRTIAGFVSSRGIGGGWLDVLFGIIDIIIGILFCVYPVGSIITFVYIFIILFLFDSLRALVFSINMARAKIGHYVFDIVMSIIMIVLAIMLLFYPRVGAIAMVYYLAITLFLFAIAEIYMFVEFRKVKNKLKKK